MILSTDKSSSLLPMVIIGVLFFMFGFVTWLNGALIPFLQIACELDHFQAYLVTMAFYISYTVMALPMSAVLHRVGYKNGMVGGLLIMVVGALIFVPAAMSRMYSIFLLALFVLGGGLTLLQMASNPFVVLVGPRSSAAVRISIMGILNKSAGVVAPLLFAALVLTDMSQFSDDALSVLRDAERALKLSELVGRLIPPYLIMAAILAVLAVFVWLSPLRDPVDQDSPSEKNSDKITKHPQLVLGAVTLFFYVGAEVIAGDTIGLFGKDLGVANYGQLTAYTMGFMLCGYVIGMLTIPRWISQERALASSAILGILLSLLVGMSDPGTSGLFSAVFGWTGIPAVPNTVFFVALFGLSNAIVWPAVWPLALADLNTHQVNIGSALLVIGISGGAIIPLMYGAVAQSSGAPHLAYLIMIPCYAFIFFFATKGHKLRSWTRVG